MYNRAEEVKSFFGPSGSGDCTLKKVLFQLNKVAISIFSYFPRRRCLSWKFPLPTASFPLTIYDHYYHPSRFISVSLNDTIIAKAELRPESLSRHHNHHSDILYRTKQYINKPFFLSYPTDYLSFQGSAPGISSF